jgi:hypothetical protein
MGSFGGDGVLLLLDGESVDIIPLVDGAALHLNGWSLAADAEVIPAVREEIGLSWFSPDADFVAVVLPGVGVEGQRVNGMSWKDMDGLLI